MSQVSSEAAPKAQATRPLVTARPKSRAATRVLLIKLAVWVVALAPAAALVRGFYRNDLTANPGDYITDQTGTWMLACLMASLAVTPIRRVTGWNEVIKLRRLIGLFAFFYAVLHVLTWIVFVHYFDVGFMVEDVVKRPFITLGMAAFLILLTLALTSTQWSIRKLGRKWQTLHRAVYVAAVAGVAHFWLLVKADTTEPVRWAFGLSVLLGLRVWWAWRKRQPSRS
jgi:sulfoxide reductase heme-binding subunit YedZ